MSRSEDERFADILGALERCLAFSPHPHSDEQGSMAYDAVVRNLAVVGGAVRSLSGETRSTMPEVPWASIAGLRNVAVHECFRVNPDPVRDIVDHQLSDLANAIRNR